MSEPTQAVHPLDTLDPVEVVRLRHAIEDDGVGIYQAPFVGNSISDVGRYLTEGGRLLPHRDWRMVWECVSELCRREPFLLDSQPPTQAQLAARQELRRRQANVLLDTALAAVDAGRGDDGLKLVDKAELTSPDCPMPGRDYDDIRKYLRRRIVVNATRPADLPDVPPLKSSHQCRRCRRWLEGEWSDADDTQRANLERQMNAGRCDDCTRREAKEAGNGKG